MTPEQIEKERQAFEAWYAQVRLPTPMHGRTFERRGEAYRLQEVEDAFLTWLARAKAAKSEIDYAYTTGFQEGHPVWIREKDMRPSDEEWVLVCIDYDDGKEVDIAFYCEGGHAFIDPPNVMIDGVTHWQPLPPPPKGD